MPKSTPSGTPYALLSSHGMGPVRDIETKIDRLFLRDVEKFERRALARLAWCCVCSVIACGCYSGAHSEAVTPLSSESAVQHAQQRSEPPEQIAFKEMSAFYCSHKRWPQTWGEFAGQFKQAEWIERFQSAELTVPRAIVSTVRYQGQGGAVNNVAFIAPPTCGSDSSPADPRAISIAGGRVLLLVPHGFSLLQASDIQARWGGAPYPDVAWEDAVSGVIVALRFGELDLAPTALEGLKPELEAAYQESVPGVGWLARAYRVDDGPARLVHHFESDSSRGRLSTMAFTFSFDSKLLTLTVVGPAEQRAAVQQVAVAVRSTLRLQ